MSQPHRSPQAGALGWALQAGLGSALLPLPQGRALNTGPIRLPRLGAGPCEALPTSPAEQWDSLPASLGRPSI